MLDEIKEQIRECKIEAESTANYREQLPEKADKIIESCDDKKCYTHIDNLPIPSKESVNEIINISREILFPGYFTREKLDPINLKYNMGQSTSVLFDILSDQVTHSIRHD